MEDRTATGEGLMISCRKKLLMQYENLGVAIRISVGWTGNGRVQDMNGILVSITDDKLANRRAWRLEGSRIPASPRCPHHYGEVLSAAGLECAKRG
jgi:hypothetical protein